MKTRIGFVGPKDSLNIISQIADEHKDELDPVYFMYNHASETGEIVETNQHLVDLWVFSGLTPYTLAKKSSSRQPFFYLNLNSSSLMKVLLESGYKDQRSLGNISVDMLEWRDITETFTDLKIPTVDVQLYEYKGYTPIKEIVDFHEKNYKDGVASVCFTCLSDVYAQLKAKMIPVYRISPTRANIRSTIKLALQYWTAFHFKQSQITVLLVKVKNADKSEQSNLMSYDVHRLDLELQSAILTFTEEISGSFVPLGSGSFIIFSTRGSFDNIGKQSSSLLEKLALITDLPANIGIGYGDTTLAAEENARLALAHAQNYDGYCAFAVEFNGKIEGPLSDKHSISFGYRNENKEVGVKLKESGVSITTFNKIISIQKNTGRHAVTANDVAVWLKMTERNARRILNDLTKTGFARIIGEEAPSSRGRPRKIYRVGLDSASIQD
ncbi:MAG TPA: hypothetical protein DEO65_19540 [Bacillus bacterium]|uniref:Transcriptional regulator n=1 Tax=Siminovitchia fordii TaxID=254759 RepID=A0ABQ4K7N3_9BACI|nr:hypothetical protein [Siminovitchia fordii]GIN21742.1 hypothetical protein J1TS3_28760 [Siminovitchia fordii]HBZ12031.1 hypothetical protein [Bacillus sp. (in: firmicutes)]